MANYPTLQQSSNSKFSPIDSTVIDLSSDGTVRGRVKHSDTVYSATVIHSYITAEEKDSILSFYEDNQNVYFTFLRKADGKYYQLIFLGRPEDVRHNVTYWSVASKMIGTLISVPANVVTYNGDLVTYNGEYVTYGA